MKEKNTKQLISPSDLSIDDDCAVKVFCLVGGVFEFAAAKLESLDNGMELSTSAGIFIFPNVISVKEPSTEAPFPKKEFFIFFTQIVVVIRKVDLWIESKMP